MKVLVEMRVRCEPVTGTPSGVAEYTLTDTTEMPQLPPRNAWLTFGPEGDVLTFGPVRWELDWLDEKQIYRISCKLDLKAGDADYDAIYKRLMYFRKNWTEQPRKR